MTPKQEKTAALWAALQKAAGRELVRAHLPNGSTYRVDLTVTGRTTPGGKVAERVAGVLTTGHPQNQNRSEDCDLDALGAYLLSKIPQAQRRELLEYLPRYRAANGALPAVPAAIVEEFSALRARLRSTTTVQRAPTISFKRA